jgi:putative membrane protein
MTLPNPNRRTLADYLQLSLNGFIMGAADVVPGVSGGTMAFILGIYDELIDSIRSAVPFLRLLIGMRWREAFGVLPWRFLLALGLGIGAAILSLANFMHWALENHPTLIYALFFGLIVASVFVVRNRIRAWVWPVLLMVPISAVAAYLLVGVRPAQTPESLWFVFLSGMLAICAMILPGISGAFILVLLGKYQYILNALTSFDLPVIIVFMLGAATGIISFSNVLRWLLNHHHDLTVAALIGFMLGSLREVWPWKMTHMVGEVPTEVMMVLPTTLGGETFMAIGLMLLGFTAVLTLDRVANQRSKTAVENL